MKKKAVTVGDVMIRDVRTVHLDIPAPYAAKRMSQHGIRHLVVTDGNGSPRGVISERDLLKQLTSTTPHGRADTSVTARQLMSKLLTTVTANTPLREAATILASKRIGCLPVLDEQGHLAGIVTVMDMLPHVNEGDAAEANDGFEFYTASPRDAVFKENGELVLPIDCLDDRKSEGQLFAVLGYAQDTKRVAVKLLAAEQEQSTPGARPVKTTEEHLVIPADDFRSRYGLQHVKDFEVTTDTNADYIVLSP